MQVVENIYSDDHTRLTLKSPRHEPITVLVPPQHYDALSKLSWCFEASKGQLYAMDFSMVVPTVFSFKTPRIYLWRYICYLETKNLNVILKRSDLADYRPESVFAK